MNRTRGRTRAVLPRSEGAARAAFGARGTCSARAAFGPRAAAAVSALAVVLAFTFAAAPAAAQIVRAFTPRYSTNATGDVTLIGNTIMSCSGGGGCNNGRNGTGGNTDNNDFNMVYVDVDGDGSTFSSSTANLNLPAGATVLWAGLYWGGESNNAARNTVRFGTPVAAYATLTAGQLSASGTDYVAITDVTTRVQAGGNGTYRVGNVYSTPNQSNKHGGWSLVVVYNLGSLPLRNLVVFDGYAHVSNGNNVTINVNGFVTPPAGVVNTRLGVVGFEGDHGLTGDNFRLNGINISDARNPANNFFNSSISLLGAAFTAKNPNYVNQLGFDADLVTANGVLPNGATSATILLTSSGDEYYPAAVTFATDLYAPVFSTSGYTKTVSDLNGAPVRAGDVLEYTLTMTNSGQDHAAQSVFRDTLPANASYVPGSLVVVSGPNAGAKTDAGGDDQMEYVGGSRSVVARLGTGANAAAGGQINIGVATSIRFRVTVNPPALTGTVISNQGWLSFNAAQSGQSFTARSDGDAAIPGEQPTVVTTVSTGVAVSGSVYEDLDHDAGLAAPEAGTGTALHVKLVPASAVAASAVAAADPVTGAYTFGVVVAGTYSLVLDTNNNLADITPGVPAGWIGTEAAGGVRAGLVVGAAGISGQNFGLWHGSRVDGNVFRDDGSGGGTANDGLRQGGESGVAAVRVRFESAACAGGVCDSMATDAAGDYTLWMPFAAAGAGAAVREVNAAGWISTGGSGGSTGSAYDRAADATIFTAASGVSYTALNFGDVPPNQWAAPGARAVSAGAFALYPHTYTARSAGSVTIAAAQAPSPAIPGWLVELYRDLDCDGALDPGEPALAAPVVLASGQVLCVLARHAAPAGAPLGALETATLSASFTYSGAVPPLTAALALDDVTTVASSGLVITKSVDRATARPGDSITYTISYTNLGPQPVSSVVIRDATPPFTTFASAACVALGGGLSGCSVSAQPAAGAAGTVVWNFTGSLLPGGTGSVSFVVTVD
jgi:uncharacterized repeat protein (TIGR01451 family)